AHLANTMLRRTETGCQAQTRAPAHRPGGLRGPWNPRRRVATGGSLRTPVWQRQPGSQRGWAYGRARVAWAKAPVHLWARWGLDLDDEHRGRLSSAAFGL